jgi:putative membrane protein
VIVLGCVLAAALYLGAAHVVPVVRGRARWPLVRSAAWVGGLGCVLVAVTGPLAAAHGDLRAHMAGHLLLGMVAPLLLVLARPVTLALRTLPLPAARRLSRVLRSAPLRVLGDPFVAVALNAAGLWVLYGTGLLTSMTHSPGLPALVPVHVLLTGWLATAAVLALDPAPHRRGVPARAVALAAGAAAHDVLAKTLYAHPPAGMTRTAAGAELMYNGGTVVHLLVAVVLWRQWYVSRGAVRSAALAAA